MVIQRSCSNTHPFFNLSYIECGTGFTFIKCFNIHMHETFQYDKCFQASASKVSRQSCNLHTSNGLHCCRAEVVILGCKTMLPSKRHSCVCDTVKFLVTIKSNKTCKGAAHQPVLLRAACLCLLPCACSTKHCGPSCLMRTLYY